MLVFSGQAAQQDDPVRAAATAIRELSKKNGFSVEEAQDPAVFTASNLARFRGVVFLSANGVSLDESQLAAFQAYIKGGGGFVGIRDAARAQVDSAWFTELIGTRPVGTLPIAETVTETAASAENPPNETKNKVFDGDNDTKWLARARTGWMQAQAGEARRGGALRADVGQRLRRPGPEGLDPAGLADGDDLDGSRQAQRTRPSPSGSRAGIQVREHHGVPVLPAQHHREQR